MSNHIVWPQNSCVLFPSLSPRVARNAKFCFKAVSQMWLHSHGLCFTIQFDYFWFKYLFISSFLFVFPPPRKTDRSERCLPTAHNWVIGSRSRIPVTTGEEWQSEPIKVGHQTSEVFAYRDQARCCAENSPCFYDFAGQRREQSPDFMSLRTQNGANCSLNCLCWILLGILLS